MAPCLAAYANQRIVLGIRPEDITEKPPGGDAAGEHTVDAAVEMLESLGAETHLSLASGAHSFVARVPADYSAAVRQKVSVVFDMRQARFFDLNTEQAVG
jgi:multiple sugar transport system ATP-binding protein